MEFIIKKLYAEISQLAKLVNATKYLKENLYIFCIYSSKNSRGKKLFNSEASIILVPKPDINA